MVQHPCSMFISSPPSLPYHLLLLITCASFICSARRGIRGIFFRRGKVTFPDFSRHEMLFFFPVEISILVDAKQIKFHWLQKSDKQKKKSPLLIFVPFPLTIYISSFSFPFFFFSSPFSLFSWPLFSQLASKNFLVKNVCGALCPPACYATECTIIVNIGVGSVKCALYYRVSQHFCTRL